MVIGKKARLEELYTAEIRPRLQGVLGYSNIMQVPRLSKIVINVGVKDAVTNSKAIQSVMDVVKAIAGQQPVKTLAKKSIAGFKLREGMPVGVKVTLRGKKMYEFLDRLVNLAFPKMRDFQGVPTGFDGGGNYNLGIKEWLIFPEVDYDTVDKIRGMNITFDTTAKDKEAAFELLKNFGFPFKRKI